MFGLGMPELIVILLIVILLFGATRLPQIAKGLGKSFSSFKQGLKETDKDDGDKEDKSSKDT